MFHEKDAQFDEKIRSYRENMRRNGTKSSYDEKFTFRRENVFDFDAWYRAHFNDDFDTTIRKERISNYKAQYQEQMERISRGQYRVRPPRPYVERKWSDIENQIAEMEEKERREKIMTALRFGMLCIISFLTIIFILETNMDGNKKPYKDPYSKQNAESSRKTE